jgi:hypothetical protein
MPRATGPILPDGASLRLKENWIPCLAALVIAVIAIVWHFIEGYWTVSFAIFILVDLYLLVALVEMSLRSKKDEWRVFELPHRLWSIPLLFCLLIAVVCSFANLYIQSRAVKNNGAVMSDRGDAVYFSVVTITTLGYGDFVPTDAKSRRLSVCIVTESRSTSALCSALTRTTSGYSDALPIFSMSPLSMWLR